MKGTGNGKKSVVRIVILQVFSVMERLSKTDNDFVAIAALERLFGKSATTKNTVNNTGSNSGLLKVFLPDSYAIFRGTADPRLNVLDIIGSLVRPRRLLTTRNTST